MTNLNPITSLSKNYLNYSERENFAKNFNANLYVSAFEGDNPCGDTKALIRQIEKYQTEDAKLWARELSLQKLTPLFEKIAGKVSGKLLEMLF